MLQKLSREPLLPLLHGGPSGSRPISPGSAAAPNRPVNKFPPRITPPPTPVPRVRSTTSWSPWAAPCHCSPSTAQLPSLPRVTRRPNRDSSQSARGTLSHPGKLIAILATLPARSVGPGKPTPTQGASRWGSSCSIASTIAVATAPGAAGLGVAREYSARHSPVALKRASLRPVPPTSTPITWATRGSGTRETAKGRAIKSGRTTAPVPASALPGRGTPAGPTGHWLGNAGWPPAGYHCDLVPPAPKN